MQKLCDDLCKAVVSEKLFFESRNEISGFFYKGEFDDIKIGEIGVVTSPIKYCEESIANTTVGFHTHPNDYNPILFDDKEVVDFPSGADIKADFFHLTKYESLFKNSIQAVVVPSLKHKQVGVFMYRPLFQIIKKLDDEKLDIISGYYQIVKSIYLLSHDHDNDQLQLKKKAGELFRTLNSIKMNEYLEHLKNNFFKNNFEEYFHGPKNLAEGTSHWPWKKKHFTIPMFDFKTSKLNIYDGKRKRKKSRSKRKKKRSFQKSILFKII
jgi:hypothetical protein